MEELKLKPKNLTEQLFCEAVVQFLKAGGKDYSKMVAITNLLQEKEGSNQQ